MDRSDISKSQPRCLPFDECSILASHFYAPYVPGAAGRELESHGAGASEKVQHLQVLEFIFIVQDVEQPLAGKIGRGTGLVTHRRENGLALELASDNSHNLHSTDLK